MGSCWGRQKAMWVIKSGLIRYRHHKFTRRVGFYSYARQPSPWWWAWALFQILDTTAARLGRGPSDNGGNAEVQAQQMAMERRFWQRRTRPMWDDGRPREEPLATAPPLASA
jgi:hypothetical protein